MTVALVLATLGGSIPASAQKPPRATESADGGHIVMASTTSTEQSGLFTHLLPRFFAKTGIQVRVVALGTGQAIAVATRGDADLLFVHDKVAEEKFVADGLGLARHDVMYNDFIVIGPASDPARLAGVRDVVRALGQIAQGRHLFLSRGDRSGTHAAELRFWKDAGIDPKASTGGWYRETGSGMGPLLNIASSMNAYALTDRGTWLNFRNRGELKVLVEGDDRLLNPYGVIVVNPARHPHVKLKQAQAFTDWILSAEGQQAIADYRIGGEALFFPNAKR
ncbi:MAG: substrate-binding domain-containing protein [Betaproteobacteria bacterium]|nr:substrate-binding domain-containing protein [Betaproteobacteria bacterium]